MDVSPAEMGRYGTGKAKMGRDMASTALLLPEGLGTLQEKTPGFEGILLWAFTDEELTS